MIIPEKCREAVQRSGVIRRRLAAGVLFSFAVLSASCSTPYGKPAGHALTTDVTVAAHNGPAEICPNTCPAPPPRPTDQSVEPSSLQQVEPPEPLLPPDYELNDVRTIPQEFGIYPPSANGLLSSTCRDELKSEFRKRYFSPWDKGPPLFDTVQTAEDMKKELGKEWFGENRRRVPVKIIESLRENCDLGRLPALNRRAITVVATNMRVLPTNRPMYKQPDGFPFDMLQQSGVKLNEPLRVLHQSRDGLWVYAESSYASGWIDARDVAYPDESMVSWWRNAEQAVIVSDMISLKDVAGAFVRIAKIGTLLPIARETEDYFEAYTAARTEPNGGVYEVLVRIPKKTAAERHPIAFNDTQIARIGNQMIGTPYGWGELFNDRDCSALVRDFFLPFGIWLPRGSYDQGNSGRTIVLNGKSPEEKARIILEKGVPFLTLVWLKGHIMLYVGSREGKPLVFHDLWGVTVKDSEGKRAKQIVGKAVITTLTPGSELALATGPLLAKISKIRIITGNCAPAAR